MRFHIPKKIAHFIGPTFGLIVLVVVIYILQKQIKHLTIAAIFEHITSIPTHVLLLALLLDLCAYLVLCGYDLLGMKYIRFKLPWYKTAFASILSYIFSNNIGMSLVGASAMRLRFYPTWGIKTFSIFQLVIFTSVSMWLGIFTISSLAFIFKPIDLPPDIDIPFRAIRPIGFILITIVIIYMLLCYYYRRTIRLPGKILFKLPKLRIAILQPLVGMIDYTLAASVLYTLLPTHDNVNFPLILTIFLISQISGMISHVPGGLGVFDAICFLMLSQFYDANVALGSIILFRIFYFLIPLIIGAFVLVIYELANITLRPPPASSP
ncbi:UPF0104 family protein [Planctomycetota bacterium]|nr:UPF0104 family protein [Planctomycetota bacterium]